MHEQEIIRILFKSHLMHYARRHRECGYARSANHGINLCFSENIYKLGEKHAACRVEDERDEAERDYCERFDAHKHLRLHLESDRYSEHERDKVRKLVLCAFAERFQNAAFPYEVAEHEEAYQFGGLRGDHSREYGYDYREKYARC